MPPRPSRPPRSQPTHFLCIPLVTPASRQQLSRSLAAFRSDVCGPLGFAVPEAAIRPVGTLHLTLGVFSFPSRVVVGGSGEGGSSGEGGGDGGNGLGRAIELLRGLRLKEILREERERAKGRGMPGVEGGKRDQDGKGKGDGKGGGDGDGEGENEGLRVTLKGLRCMQGDKEKATVLYAPPVDPLGTLQGFCERVKKVFVEEGVMVEEGRPLLLHVTVVNTVYVKGKEKGKGGRKGERVTVDAREMLERYDDEIWAEGVDVEGVQICRMGAKKRVVDGEEDEAYEIEAEVKF